MHLGHAIAPALLAGRDRDRLPVLQLALAQLRIDLDHRAFGQYRQDALHAEFGGLLHDEIHALAARHALQQSDVERRLPFDRIVRADTGPDFLAVTFQRARVLATAAVE